MGESEATDASKTTLSNETDNNTTENSELVLTFKSFPNTPDLVKAREELTGTNNESLSNAVASHPVDIKDVILEHSSKMLKLLFRIKQKEEALLKQSKSTAEQTSYIPGSLQDGNPISAPRYYKDNPKLDGIAARGHDENESRK